MPLPRPTILLFASLFGAALFTTSLAQQQTAPTGGRAFECHGFIADRAADDWFKFGDYTVEAFQFLPVTNKTLTRAGVHLWLPDHSRWCWEWDGTRYITIQRDLPVGADVNGNGIPDLLIHQYHHGNYCDDNVYLIELGERPRFLYRAESGMQAGPDGQGYAECGVRLRDLDEDGTIYELIAMDNSHPRTGLEGPMSEFDACGVPRLPVVFAPDKDGLYRPATIGSEPGDLPARSVESVYHEYITRYLLEYAEALASENAQHDQPTCAAFRLAMTLVYMGRQAEEISTVVQSLAHEMDTDLLVLAAFERAASSRVVGHLYR